MLSSSSHHRSFIIAASCWFLLTLTSYGHDDAASSSSASSLVHLSTTTTGAAANNNNNDDSGPCQAAKYQNKTRLFVLTDISNEPDDQMSLVRLLTYANELDIINIAVVTSTWLNDTLDTASVFKVINQGYARVVDDLNRHAPADHQYPPAEDIAARVVEGHPVYGLAAVWDEPTRSNASAALVAAVDEATEDNPQWVSI